MVILSNATLVKGLVIGLSIAGASLIGLEAKAGSHDAAPAAEMETPEAAPTVMEGGSIVDVAASTGTFTTLLQAAEAAGLAEVLDADGPFTVFAPTDDAFAELPPGAIELLLQPENQDLLVSLLTYHVVPGEVPSTQITSGLVDTLGGGLAVLVTEGRVIVNDGSVIQPDVAADNGIIHVMNRVLMPRQLRDTITTQLNANR